MRQLKHGVYQIRNIQSGERYIGSAAGRGFRNRWGTHILDLNKQRHHSRYLQRVWNKYGADVFIFEVLLYCNPENCLMYKQIALDYYRPGYNSSPTAGSCLGIKHSRLTKDKIGNAHRGKIMSQITRDKMSDYHTRNQTVNRLHTPLARSKALRSRQQSDQCRGESIYNSKATKIQVREIRLLYSQGLNFNQISKIHGNLNRRTVRDICLRNSWKHV